LRGPGTIARMVDTEPGVRVAPSWVDRLTDQIDRLPVPAWLVYLVVFLALIVTANAAGWLDGYLPIGSFDVYLSSVAAFGLGCLAAIHYLDREAGIALERLRPALTVSDEGYGDLRYQLTTLPAGTTIAWTFVGLAIAIAYSFDSSLVGRGSASVALDVSAALLGGPLLAVLFYHTVRQLRLVSQIQGQLTEIDIFQLDPLLAFSGVTARTGMIILGMGYLLTAPEPAPFDWAVIGFVAISILLGIAAFVLPMYGMHQRIAHEKSRLGSLANRDLQVALADLSSRAQARDLTNADALNQQLSSLLTKRDVIAGIPTWPWEPATVRGFATAVLLPIVLWLVFRALEQLFA
jgi:hypothetical protein